MILELLVTAIVSLVAVGDSVRTDLIEPGTLLTDTITIPTANPDQIEVTIQTIEIPLGTDSAIVDILCDPHGMGIGGFDLRISTISDLISIVALGPGEMQVDNHWQMFNASEVFPEKLWHIVSLARSMSNDDSLAVLGWSGEVSIARLILRIKEPKIFFDTLHTIQFFWGKCSDNTFSDSTGSYLMVGHLTESESNATATGGGKIDPYAGPSADCFKASARPPADLIRFKNGGVTIRSEIDSVRLPDSTDVDTIPPGWIE